MVPVGEECADSGDEGERLVQHHMVAGLGDFDHGGGAAEQVEHVLADFVGHEDRHLAAHHGDYATFFHSGGHWQKARENFWLDDAAETFEQLTAIVGAGKVRKR